MLELSPYRDPGFEKPHVSVRREPNGELFMSSAAPAVQARRSIFEFLERWALAAPERTFLAKLDNGQWVGPSYAEALETAKSIGQWLLDMGLGKETPVAILSGNSLEHGLLMMGCLAVGIPVAPISPSYSVMPGGAQRLVEIGEVLRPALVFAQNSKVFSIAREIDEFASATWITADGGSGTVPYSELTRVSVKPSFERASAAVDHDTIAKILFTSGSTGSPKGVINTQGMLCSCVEMAGQMITRQEPPVQVEWMPWHHTMGGNAVFNGILKDGGTHCIDEGRPTPDGFGRTIQSLKSISPTSISTVPAGFGLLVNALRDDEALRLSLFNRLRSVLCGGAALPDGLIEQFQGYAISTVGERIPVLSGYGTTETAPTVCVTNWPSETSGELGIPIPGLELKLVPVDDRYELRVKGPNVTPGYLRRPELSAAVFDQDGYYCVGDAVAFMAPGAPDRGLRFMGRISENFKLSTGTWVLVSEVRLAVLGAVSRALSDVVVVGEGHDELAILAWPCASGGAPFLTNPQASGDIKQLCRDEGLISHVRTALAQYNLGKGSSFRIAAFRLLDRPPSLAHGEITDKGYVNQRAVIRSRTSEIASLFDKAHSEVVIRIQPELA